MTIPNIEKTGISEGNKRWTAINLMRDMKGQSPEEICTAIYAVGLHKSYSEAVSFYNWAIKNGYVERYAAHPTRSGVRPVVYSLHYEKPTSYDSAIEALRKHLAIENPNRGALTQLMRDLSNFDSIGRTADSYTLKQYNRRISHNAYKAMDNYSSWHDNTTNEHSTPVTVMLEWIKLRLTYVTNEQIKNYFNENPICTILSSENDNIPNHYRSSGIYKVRYASAGIVIIESPKHPYLRWE